MDDSRQEYPALLVCIVTVLIRAKVEADSLKRSLPPAQAVSVLEERVKLIGKINFDIAEWLQVRSLGQEYPLRCSLRRLGEKARRRCVRTRASEACEQGLERGILGAWVSEPSSNVGQLLKDEGCFDHLGRAFCAQ